MLVFLWIIFFLLFGVRCILKVSKMLLLLSEYFYSITFGTLKKTPIVEGALFRASSLDIGGFNVSSLNTLVVFMGYAFGLTSSVFNLFSFSIYDNISLSW